MDCYVIGTASENATQTTQLMLDSQRLCLRFSKLPGMAVAKFYGHFCAAISAQYCCVCGRCLALPCVTMDARGAAAARAVALSVCQANDWACSENVRLCGAVERARLAIERGDRPAALRLLLRCARAVTTALCGASASAPWCK